MAHGNADKYESNASMGGTPASASLVCPNRQTGDSAISARGQLVITYPMASLGRDWPHMPCARVMLNMSCTLRPPRRRCSMRKKLKLGGLLGVLLNVMAIDDQAQAPTGIKRNVLVKDCGQTSRCERLVISTVRDSD